MAQCRVERLCEAESAHAKAFRTERHLLPAARRVRRTEGHSLLDCCSTSLAAFWCLCLYVSCGGVWRCLCVQVAERLATALSRPRQLRASSCKTELPTILRDVVQAIQGGADRCFSGSRPANRTADIDYGDEEEHRHYSTVAQLRSTRLTASVVPAI